MTADILAGVALLGATITTGLTAGVFALYAHWPETVSATERRDGTA